MSNCINNPIENDNDKEEEIDYWELFQSESDQTRNLILDYQVKKCEIHKESEFFELSQFESQRDNHRYHFEYCNKYLFESERRRKPFKNGKLLYFHNICQFANNETNCLKGDLCQFSHNQLEIKFHPLLYRKEMCKTYDCEKRYCNNSHRIQDLRFLPLNRKNIDSYYNNKTLENPLSKTKVEDKEEMLNKLNLDIKNLLDELDLDNLNFDDNENIDNTDDKTDKKANEDKTANTYSQNSKIVEISDNDIFKNYKDNRSNSISSANNLKHNLLIDCNNQISNNSKHNIGPYETSISSMNKEFSGNIEKDLLSQKFDLQTFKTVKCNITIKHNEKHCIFFHSIKDRRRLIIKYSSDTCKYAAADKNCPDGDDCLLSHNKVEMFYHPDRFKTKFCSQYNPDNNNKNNNINFKNLKSCAYGRFCSFAHSEEEIKINLIHKLNFDEEFFLIHFKTVVCPFTHDHDKATCVYSHNWQDYRRNPKIFTYKNFPCNIWDIKKTILNYRDGCLKESSCLLCHGWKEEDFHPLNYKTRKCKNFNKLCEKNIYCPFFHNLDEKRKIPIKIKQEYEMRLENKLDLQKYSTMLNDSFNIGDRSNSVKSNLSDNVTYGNQNRKLNNTFHRNMPNNNVNYANVNQFKNYNNPNKIHENFIQKNISNFNQNPNNHSNLGYMQNPVFNIHLNNSTTMGNLKNMNNLLLNNSNKNIISYNYVNTNKPFPQQRYSYNPVNSAYVNDKNINRLNYSGNMMNTHSEKNIWGFPNEFPLHNNISPNNSFVRGSYSDNEMNDNRFFNPKNNRNNHKSFSSNFSQSSFDRFNESFKNDRDFEMISGNQDDDSIEINERDLNSDNNRQISSKGINVSDYCKNDIYSIEKIEETNNFLRELIKEGESNFLMDEKLDAKDINFRNEDSLNKGNFLSFIKSHQFNNLYNLINSNKITLNELVKFSDQKIINLIEPENRNKISILIDVLMKFDEKIEGDSVMESLNNLDFK